MEKQRVSVDTIVRTIVAAIVLINSIMVMTGKTPLDLDENTIYAVVSGVAQIATAIWIWWKNNSFTVAAITADKVKDELKKGINEEEGLIDEAEEV